VSAALTSSTLFGPIVSGGDVEAWCVDLLRTWYGTYLSEVERQAGLDAGTLQRPRAVVRVPSLDKWPEDQLPALLVISVGTAETPLKQGSGSYRARWDVGTACICSARGEAETRAIAMLYGAALRALFIQRPSLDGRAHGTVWTSETYDDLDYDDGRTLAAAIVGFTVEVHDVVVGNAGPLAPDDPLDPDTQPWPLDPIADEVAVVVNGQAVFAPPSPAPHEPPPPPDEPPPVLARIEPDSAGDWNVELHAFGSGFTPESLIVLGGDVYETTYVSGGDLSTVVPGSLAAGVYPVLVRTGTQESGALSFTAL